MTKAKPNRRATKGFLVEMLSGEAGISIMAKVFITVMLTDIKKNLLGKIRGVIPDGAAIDQAYVDRLACAVYYCAISAPYQHMVETAGSVVNFAWNLMLQHPEDCSPELLYKTMQDGFSKISPAMAAACTMEVLQQTALLLLNDWHDHDGSPTDAETLHFDIHFYFDESLHMLSSPDDEAIKREGQAYITNMPPEDLADYDPALIEQVRAWKPEGDTQH